MSRSTLSAAMILGSIAPALAQGAVLSAAPYCPDLKQVTAAATSEGRLSRLAGKIREGSFSETTLPLTGWSDCSVYGARMYTCDSQPLESAEQAERALSVVVAEVKACLAPGWAEVAERSSSTYAVLHGARALSITISTDQTDDRKHVVRLTMFRRGGQ